MTLLGRRTMKIERTLDGTIEIRLSNDPNRFECLAEIVRKKLSGKWMKQLEGIDQSYWDLDVHGKTVTVHREHYLGVSVFCDDDAPRRQMLEQLQRDFEGMTLE